MTVNRGYAEETDTQNKKDFRFPLCQARQDFSIRPTTARLDAPVISDVAVGILPSSEMPSRKQAAPIPMYRSVSLASEIWGRLSCDWGLSSACCREDERREVNVSIK